MDEFGMPCVHFSVEIAKFAPSGVSSQCFFLKYAPGNPEVTF